MSVNAEDCPTEKMLAEIWCEVLRIADVGPDDDFFAIGGDSISVAKALGRVRERIRSDASIDLLFDHPTLADLARRLDELPS